MCVDNLEPGRELDALVAKHIFARYWTDLYWIDFNQCERRPGDYPPYSTDIKAAWEIVEKLSPAEDEFRLVSFHRNGWFCTFAYFEGDEVEADTAPHAICLAALKAVGVDKLNPEES